MDTVAVRISDEVQWFSDNGLVATMSGLERRVNGATAVSCKEVLAPKCESAGGVLQTVPLEFSGDHLLINAELFSADDLTAELIDVNGAVIAGFEEAKAVVTESRVGWYEVHWCMNRMRGGYLIMNNVEQPAAIRFRLARGSVGGFGIVDSVAPAHTVEVAGAEPIELSNHPQLFLDDYMIGRMSNLQREMKQGNTPSSLCPALGLPTRDRGVPAARCMGLPHSAARHNARNNSRTVSPTSAV